MTEPERAAASLRFLAEASEQLSESLDYDRTLSRVTRLAEPYLADWCTVDLLESDGRIHRVAAARLDPTREALLHETLQQFPMQLDELRGVPIALRTMSQQLWQAAKLATMGELAASIAHELNNPLGTISLRIESLLARTSADDARHRALVIVEQEVERMAGLVSNLLHFSRAGGPQISTVDVREELENTLELMHYHLRNHRIEVVRAFAPDVPLIHADRQRLRQLFLNLFTNASDAMPEGGTLTLGVRAGGDGATACPAGIVVEIGDTGVGIDPDLMARVLEPFYTTKPEGKGTGLGLAICRRIVQEHHGTFDLDSASGQGTTVRITLPGSNGGESLVGESMRG